MLNEKLCTACRARPVDKIKHLQCKHKTAKQVMTVEAHVFMKRMHSSNTTRFSDLTETQKSKFDQPACLIKYHKE